MAPARRGPEPSSSSPGAEYGLLVMSVRPLPGKGHVGLEGEVWFALLLYVITLRNSRGMGNLRRTVPGGCVVRKPERPRAGAAGPAGVPRGSGQGGLLSCQAEKRFGAGVHPCGSRWISGRSRAGIRRGQPDPAAGEHPSEMSPPGVSRRRAGTGRPGFAGRPGRPGAHRSPGRCRSRCGVPASGRRRSGALAAFWPGRCRR